MNRNDLLMMIDPQDNVAVCLRSILKDSVYQIGGCDFRAQRDYQLGDKIATRAIHVGESVIKYGVSIGSATQEIASGDWVHVHNIKSDYIDTNIYKGKSR